MRGLSPNAEAIRRKLSGVAFVGRVPELAELTSIELGSLAALVWRPRPHDADDFALRTCEALRVGSPVFDEDSAIAALGALAESAAESSDDRGVAGWIRDAAAQVVHGCEVGVTPLVRSALVKLLRHVTDRDFDPMMISLRACAGQTSSPHPDALAAREAEFLAGLPDPRDRIAMARICAEWAFGNDDDALTPRGADPLALLPGYLSCAEAITREALGRLQDIHADRRPYAPDKAFSVAESQVVMRALRAGLDQDAPWATQAAGPLFAAVAVAPGGRAKTVPSQSAATSIAKAIAERPSFRVVADLKAALAGVRHAGVKKKAARFATIAERRLFERDDFLLELDPSVRIPKAMGATIVRALEALLLTRDPFGFDDWHRHVLANPAVARPASALVWRVAGRSVLVARKGADWTFLDPHGDPVELPPGPVSLWHPLEHATEADPWRALVMARRIEQPFNQVFRETYSVSSLAALRSVDLDVRTLLGLARAQGWVLNHRGVLVRRLGGLRVQVDVGGVHPGATGRTRCGELELFAAAGREPLRLEEQDPKLLSECIRALDLLVSVSAFALSDETATARARRAVLSRLFGEDPDANRPHVAGRYVRIADVSISIATGLAKRAGAELEVPPLDDATVLPYPDPVLRRIVSAVNHA